MRVCVCVCLMETGKALQGSMAPETFQELISTHQRAFRVTGDKVRERAFKVCVCVCADDVVSFFPHYMRLESFISMTQRKAEHLVYLFSLVWLKFMERVSNT